MKFKIFPVLVFIICILFPVISLAQNKVVVVPLIEEVQCKCSGTLRGERWCDNGDGTITDMANCLVWLQNASWGGKKYWRINSSCTGSAGDVECFYDAHERAGTLSEADTTAGLSDGSVRGEWRLPTYIELRGLIEGKSPILCSSYICNLYGFEKVRSDTYWSSTTLYSIPSSALRVNLETGVLGSSNKGDFNHYVWPVRTIK